MTKQQIKCPNCDTAIDVNDILYHQLHEQVNKEYNGKLAILEQQQEKLNETIAEGVKKQVAKQKSDIEKKLRTEIASESAETIESLEEQLKQKSSEVKELNKVKLELLQTKQEKDELEGKIYIEAAEKFTNQLNTEKSKIRSQVEKDMELKIADKDNTIEKLLLQTKDMQRKIEQGSMQSQGETQELAIEKYLRANFPLNDIDEVKKGAYGADCLQTVNTHTRENCGSIYYESKRTKEFSGAWIEKFKGDMREQGALIGVLVTEAMPKGMERMGLKDGVWLCSYDEFKGLCFALHEAVIMYSDAMVSQENKGDKMVMLYDYLTGNEFKLHVEAIVEGFSQMEVDLMSERRSMESIWKRREKQIQKVLHSTVHMYSAIKGIGGNSIGTIPALELGTGENAAA